METITIELSKQEAVQVIQGLGTRPYAEVVELIKRISSEYQDKFIPKQPTKSKSK